MIAVLGNISSTLAQLHYYAGEIEERLRTLQLDFATRSSWNNLRTQLNDRVAYLTLQLIQFSDKFGKEAQALNDGSRSFPPPVPPRTRPPRMGIGANLSGQSSGSGPLSSLPLQHARDRPAPAQAQAPQLPLHVLEVQRLRQATDQTALFTFFYNYFKTLYTQK